MVTFLLASQRNPPKTGTLKKRTDTWRRWFSSQLSVRNASVKPIEKHWISGCDFESGVDIRNFRGLWSFSIHVGLLMASNHFPRKLMSVCTSSDLCITRRRARFSPAPHLRFFLVRACSGLPAFRTTQTDIGASKGSRPSAKLQATEAEVRAPPASRRAGGSRRKSCGASERGAPRSGGEELRPSAALERSSGPA